MTWNITEWVGLLLSQGEQRYDDENSDAIDICLQYIALLNVKSLQPSQFYKRFGSLSTIY